MHAEPPPLPPAVEAAENDVTNHATEIESCNDPSGSEQISDKERLIQRIRKRIGRKQVSASSFSSPTGL